MLSCVQRRSRKKFPNAAEVNLRMGTGGRRRCVWDRFSFEGQREGKKKKTWMICLQPSAEMKAYRKRCWGLERGWITGGTQGWSTATGSPASSCGWQSSLLHKRVKTRWVLEMRRLKGVWSAPSIQAQRWWWLWPSASHRWPISRNCAKLAFVEISFGPAEKPMVCLWGVLICRSDNMCQLSGQSSSLEGACNSFIH